MRTNKHILWAINRLFPAGVCVCVTVWKRERVCTVDPSWCMHSAYECVCMCMCCQQAGGLGHPVKVMCGGYLESGRGRLAHCSLLIFYIAALSSLIIFYSAAITNCQEKKEPPATAHATVVKPGKRTNTQTHTHTRMVKYAGTQRGNWRRECHMSTFTVNSVAHTEW